MITIFESILHMSVVASIVILAVVLIRQCLKKAPKVISYALWAVVLLRLLCPFTVESALSVIPESIGDNEVIEDIADSYVGDTNIYFDNTPAYEIAVEAGVQPIPSYGNAGGSYVVTAPDGVSEGATLKTELMPILNVLWLCGIMAMAAWAIIDWLRLRSCLRTAIREEDGVYMTDAVDSPFVLGLFRPKIYLPVALGESEREYILMHERCHIRRGDHWIKLLAFAALAVHWFNPLVWIAFVLANQDMEMSCDEAVIKSLGGEVRADYSASLLALATGKGRVSVTPLAFGEGDTGGRIRNLASWRKPTIWIIIVAVAVCIFAAVCLLTDPVSPKAQINVYGSIYTYSGKEKTLPAEPGVIYLGRLEGVTHNSSEPPTDTLHGTNLDPKYAGQDMLLPDIRSLYLYDEEGFYLVFELDKDSETPKIPESPRTEVARGDFDRDGREDYIEVSKADPYSEALRIRLVDAETDIVLWTESTSVAEDEQKVFIHRIGEDSLDYIIIDSYDPAEEWYYSRTIYINDGREKVVERSEGELKLPQAESDEEFALYMSSSLPKNSIVMLSTLGGWTILGPLKSPERPAPESIEVFSGDFDHDGEDEVAVVMPDPMHGGQLWNLYLMNPDGSIAWSEEGFATAHAGHNCILAYEDADGLDYLVRYNPYMNQGIASYRCQQFYIDNSNIRNYKEVVHREWLLEFKDATGETAEMKEFAAAMEALLGRSYVLLSTLNFELQIGPIRGDAAGLLPVSFGLEAEGEAWEDFCKANFSGMMEQNIAHYTWEMYVDGVMVSGTPRNEAWFYGDDWLHRSEMVTEDGTYIQTTLEKDGVQYLWSRNPNGQQILSSDSGEFGGYGRGALDSWLDYDLSFISKAETDKTTELVFEVFADEGNPNNARISYMFDQRMRLSEARFESDIPHTDENGQVTMRRQCIVVAFPKVSEPMCRDKIKEAYEEMLAAEGMENMALGAEAADCLAALEEVLSSNVLHAKIVYGAMDGTNVSEIWRCGEDYFCSNSGQGYSYGSVSVNGKGYSYEKTSLGRIWSALAQPEPMPISSLPVSLDYDRKFLGTVESGVGWTVNFHLESIGRSYANGPTTESFYFNSDGKLYSYSLETDMGSDAAGNKMRYMVGYDFFTTTQRESRQAIREYFDEAELNHVSVYKEVVESDALEKYGALIDAIMEDYLEEYKGNPMNFKSAELTRLVYRGGYDHADGSRVDIFDFRFALVPTVIDSSAVAGGAYLDTQNRFQGFGPAYLAVKHFDGNAVKYAVLSDSWSFNADGEIDSLNGGMVETALVPVE